ncbi:23S rRNA (adenine(2503)-C(2))-methyltransferase RlmN [Gloeobacter kilaueensis]|uniref:Probable dual-specificity RNA methyltransferase RlmN n=1 Tax=Gloeobacter kilaueensis (strain ATCC BAA-2537 / CCAP 1431/1 / ULC 316 / JS1) TaxID=1183438 RepID=U5QRQ8_GLOK1|nr:23S rRNA (adenine(2503)-C(2))-methyltransferase RlmN [Gloeobacter kilaueensis]AGY60370.1 radical SAM enzyme, Cfr family [Gloeobacter kilaueensis JS1]
MVTPLLGQDAEALRLWVESEGQPAYRAQQLHRWLYQRGLRSLMEVTDWPKPWREKLQDVPVGRSHLLRESIAPDGTIKFLLVAADNEAIETVGIPGPGRLTVCVSSQVGCPMACCFCATGKSGFARDLGVHEIVDQVLTVQERFEQRVSHVVFMGMGEPLLNLDAVVRSLTVLNRDIGIGQRQMTISTVGVPGRIAELATYKLQATLAVSLHAPNQELRAQLIPTARRYPLDQLIADCRNYVQSTGRRLSFEYTLLSGVNDELKHARQLAGLLRGFQAHVNLIPYNPIEGGEFARPDNERVQRFAQELARHKLVASVRRTRGLEESAACGQLRRQQVP